jgi:hypothetical protein
VGVTFLLLIPLISFVLDYTSWLEACWLKRAVGRDYDDGPKRDPSYFKTDDIFTRNALLSSALLFVWLASRSVGADKAAAGLAALVLFVAHVGFAIWSFRNNLRALLPSTSTDADRRH